MTHRSTSPAPLAWTAALVLALGFGVAACGVDESTGAPSRAAGSVLRQAAPVVPQAKVAPAPKPLVVAAAPRPVVTVAPRPPATTAPRTQSAPRRTPKLPPAKVAADPSGTGHRPGPFPDKVPTRFAAPADRYAFLVGVQHYRSPTHDTVASVGDVRLIRQTLLAAGWLPGNIRVVTDEQATGAAIRSGMDWLAAKSVDGKTFSFFHYSGHVKQFGSQHEALWPIDRDWVHDSQVTARLNQVRGRMWVDIAGCEAASFMPGLPSSRVLFSGSSKATEKSYEQPAWQASVWTGLLFRTAPARADADGDGQVVIGEALRYSQYFAQVVTRGQRPYGKQTPQVAGDSVRGWTLANPPA